MQRRPGDLQTMQKVAEAWERIDQLGLSGRRRFFDKVPAREMVWMLASCSLLAGGMAAGVYIGFPWGLVASVGGVVAALFCSWISGAMDGNSSAERRIRAEIVRLGMCSACYYTLPGRDEATSRGGEGPPPAEGVCCAECGAWWRWPDETTAD